MGRPMHDVDATSLGSEKTSTTKKSSTQWFISFKTVALGFMRE